ncbi:hypothetical protein [Empedobacter falsenii]|uniref:hypothetical protein n=1 Tax=Empedobacter falsenii TaxID=343874 RepID=UPI003A80C198
MSKKKQKIDTPLDSEYRDLALEMAVQNFEEFCNYAGVNKKQLLICIERKKGKTFGQISQKLNIAKSTVQDTCNRCIK